MPKLLPKFPQSLCNPITSVYVQSYYISMCAIRLHNVCNRVTQRGQLDYTRCVIELPNVKKSNYLAQVNEWLSITSIRLQE